MRKPMKILIIFLLLAATTSCVSSGKKFQETIQRSAADSESPAVREERFALQMMEKLFLMRLL
jgi:hypothetical protein